VTTGFLPDKLQVIRAPVDLYTTTVSDCQSPFRRRVKNPAALAKLRRDE
jgi:hypothetical protein